MWCSGFWHRVVLEVDTTVSEQHAASVFAVEVIRVTMWLGYIDRMTRNVITQNRGSGREGNDLPWSWRQYAAAADKTIRCHNPEDHSPNTHGFENLQIYNDIMYYLYFFAQTEHYRTNIVFPLTACVSKLPHFTKIHSKMFRSFLFSQCMLIVQPIEIRRWKCVDVR
jgi:hypothetical protein